MATRKKKTTVQIAYLRRKRTILWILMAMLVVFGTFWAFISWHTFQRYSERWLVSPVQLFINAPKYISANEDEEIRFAIENTQNRDVSITFLLVNDGSAIGFLGVENKNVIYSGDIHAQEQVNRQIKVFFPLGDKILGKSAELSIWGSVGNLQIKKVTGLSIDIAFMPWAKSLGRYLGTASAGLALWLAKEIWNQISEQATKTE